MLDATNENQLRELGSHTFDAVVSNMALMDMSDIGPLFTAVPQLLKLRGRFVFSTMHPAFNSNNPAFVAEMTDVDGTISETYSLKLSRSYIRSVSRDCDYRATGRAVRLSSSLQELFGPAFQVGLVLDGLLEPKLPDATSSTRWSSWLNFHEFPPVLVARFKKI